MHALWLKRVGRGVVDGDEGEVSLEHFVGGEAGNAGATGVPVGNHAGAVDGKDGVEEAIEEGFVEGLGHYGFLGDGKGHSGVFPGLLAFMQGGGSPPMCRIRYGRVRGKWEGLWGVV